MNNLEIVTTPIEIGYTDLIDLNVIRKRELPFDEQSMANIMKDSHIFKFFIESYHSYLEKK